MIDNGYAPSTAKNPNELTESKGWQELMDKHLPDSKLLTVHEEALDATKIHGSLTEPDREVPDIPTRLRAVELGYKLKKRLGEGGISIIGEKVIAILGGISMTNVSSNNGD